MHDTNVATPAGDAEVSRPPLLRQARESAGLHIAALAAALKVPVKKLEALEAGRYDELPDMTFARALASSACRQLKVDPAPVLEQIPAGVTPRLGDSILTLNTPFKPASGEMPASPAGWLSRPAVLAAIALMLGALVLVFLPDMATVAPAASGGGGTIDAAPSDPVMTTEPAPSVAAAASDTAASTESLTAEATLVPSSTQNPGLRVTESSADSSAVASATVSTGAAADASHSPLSIRATGESWVEVVNGSGTVLIQRMLKSGDVVEVSSAPPYSVVLGRVDAVQVMVRGRAFDASPYARNSVARFEVK